MVEIIIYKIKLFLKKKLANFWYWSMTPLAYYFSTEKINKRYNKKQSKITQEQFIRWVAEDIVRYLIKYKNSSIDILICDYARDDDFWNDCDLNGPAPYYLKRDKTRTAFYKFKKSIELQEKVVEKLKTYPEIIVVEEVDEDILRHSSWRRIDNYQKTVEVKYKK